MMLLRQSLGLSLKRQIADRDSRMLEQLRFRLLVVVR
jgi:negative regulator of sigma E activity